MAGVSLLLRAAGDVAGEVTVVDLQGQVVGRASVTSESDVSRTRWDGRTLSGVPVPSGVYYLRVPQADGPALKGVTVVR